MVPSSQRAIIFSRIWWARLEQSQKGQSSGGVMGPPWRDGEGVWGVASGQSAI